MVRLRVDLQKPPKKWPCMPSYLKSAITVFVVWISFKSRNNLSTCKLIYVSLSFHFPFSICICFVNKCRILQRFSSFALILLPTLLVVFYHFSFPVFSFGCAFFIDLAHMKLLHNFSCRCYFIRRQSCHCCRHHSAISDIEPP